MKTSLLALLFVVFVGTLCCCALARPTFGAAGQHHAAFMKKKVLQQQPTTTTTGAAPGDKVNYFTQVTPTNMSQRIFSCKF